MRNREIEDKALINIKHSISALIVDQEEDVGILVILGAGILGALLMLIIIGKGKIDLLIELSNKSVCTFPGLALVCWIYKERREDADMRDKEREILRRRSLRNSIRGH